MSSSTERDEVSSPQSEKTGNDVQKVAELKEYLESRVAELEGEIGKLKDMLSIVDKTLREKSFVPAIALRGIQHEASTVETKNREGKDLPAQPALKAKTISKPNERQLRRLKDSMILATAHIDSQRVTIVPSKDVRLSKHAPPFESFFVNRILVGLKSKDEEDSKNGKLGADQVLEYIIEESQGNISSVTVSNYRDSLRLNEILNTLTWALTRMLEKK